MILVTLLQHASEDRISAAETLAQAIEVLVPLGIRHDLIKALRQFERAAGRAVISERIRRKTYSLLVRHWKRAPRPPVADPRSSFRILPGAPS